MKSKLPRLTLTIATLAAAAAIAWQGRNVPPNNADSPVASITQPVANPPTSEEASDAPYRVPRTAADHAKPATAAPTRSPSASSSPILADKVQPSPGDVLLTQVAAQLERRTSVSARLRHQVFIAGKQLYGLGSYWQQGTGDELRVRYELQIAGQEADLLQVSNGRYLWNERRLPIGRTVTGIDLRQLRAEAEVSAARLDELKPGQASWSTTQPELAAYYGGLPSLISSLSEAFAYLPPQAMRLAVQSGDEAQPASMPVYAVVGHWRPEKIAALLANSDAAAAPMAMVPARLPEEVLILVGQVYSLP